MLQETDIIPYHLSPPPGERVVVLAPHPDDETLGCGGAIRLLVEGGKKVMVLFLTSGDKADPAHALSIQHVHSEDPRRSHITGYSLLREKESARALSVLGVGDYEFLRFPDREVHLHYRDAFEMLLNAVDEYEPDTIYAPSMVELNPDHRTAAALSLEIQKVRAERLTGSVQPLPLQVIFYEVTVPLRPNLLVDITAVYVRKKRAVKKYKSQLSVVDYLRHISSLNAFRSLTVKGPLYVEAFWHVESPPRDESISAWMGYQEIIETKF